MRRVTARANFPRRSPDDEDDEIYIRNCSRVHRNYGAYNGRRLEFPGIIPTLPGRYSLLRLIYDRFAIPDPPRVPYLPAGIYDAVDLVYVRGSLGVISLDSAGPNFHTRRTQVRKLRASAIPRRGLICDVRRLYPPHPTLWRTRVNFLVLRESCHVYYIRRDRISRANRRTEARRERDRAARGGLKSRFPIAHSDTDGERRDMRGAAVTRDV